MTAYKPGDEALVRVTVSHVMDEFPTVDAGELPAVLATFQTLNFGAMGGWVKAADLLPVSQPDDDTIERAAEALCRRLHPASWTWIKKPKTCMDCENSAALLAALLASPVREPEEATPALERVRRYLRDLDAFYGDEPIDDLLDNAEGGFDSAALLLSDIRVLAAAREPGRSEAEIKADCPHGHVRPSGCPLCTGVDS